MPQKQATDADVALSYDGQTADFLAKIRSDKRDVLEMSAHGSVRVLLDGAFTASFDETGALVLALVWLVGLTVLAAGQFHRFAAQRH